MVIDFSKTDLRKRPRFILRNLSGDVIGFLSKVLNPSGIFNYNEVSEIEFEYPSQVNGVSLDEYDSLTGMRVIEVQGYGQFLLRKPVEVDDGVVRKKKCKAYSLEYEFTNKGITLEEGTYNFWNPLMPNDTILGMILSEVKSWGLGKVSTDLIGKYRTFSVNNKNLYDWMKSDLQETFGCIFDFDTNTRTINVRSVSDIVYTKPIYLSTRNLIKEIEVEENTDELVTALEVNGAEGVSIRSVNPMGINRIYNLDAYMNEKFFSADMIKKWNNWKTTFENNQQPYFQLVLALNMQISKLAAETGVLAELEGELTALESKKATVMQAMSIDAAKQSDLNSVNSEIAKKNTEIQNQKKLINSLNSQIENLNKQLKTINANTSFSAFFSDSELAILDRYFKYGSLTDTTFVATSKDSYAVDAKTIKNITSSFSIRNLTSITKSTYGSNTTFYSLRGGNISINVSDVSISTTIISGTMQVNSDLSFVCSLYLEKGTANGTEFEGGTITWTGNLRSNVTTTTSSIQFSTSASTMYITHDVSEYQRMSIEWELYEYGKEMLEKLSSPSYSFDVSLINFLALDDFISFIKNFSLGERVYLRTSAGVIAPIVTGVEINFDDLSDFKVSFGNVYRLDDSSFSLQDLIKDSVSSGATLDFNRYNYSTFTSSGAKTQVRDFMNSALDTMKNMILSGDHNEITIDQAGLRCRKYDEKSDTYSPKQLWIAHNALMFTDDNWNSAMIGIGEFVDKNLGSIYGVIAPAIVGTILAGNNLIIETEGGFFRVDSSGVHIDSLKFLITHGTGKGNSLSDVLDDIDDDISSTNKDLGSLRKDFESVTTKTASGVTLNSEDLKGVINSLQSQMQNAKGNVLFDFDGFWLMNGTSKATTTKAIWMNENGILFGTGPRVSNPGATGSGWTWTTAIGHDGITTEALRSKTLNSATIVGGKITIGKDSTSDREYLEIDTDGSLGIGKSTSGKWNFHVDKAGKIEAGWNGSQYNFSVDTSGNIKANSINVTNGTFSGTLNAANGTFAGSLQAASGTFSGSLQAATGTFKGELQAATGTFSGSLQAASGTFTGIVRASDFQTTSGVSMMTGNKFKSDYLDLYGLTIRNKLNNTVTFSVDSYGRITLNGTVDGTISGQITLGAGSTINWATVTEYNSTSSAAYRRANDAYNYADDAYSYAGNAYSRANTAYNNADTAYNYAMTAYNNRVTDENIFNVLTSGGTRFGIFSDSYSGRLYINANYIRSGTIDADYITLGSSYGGFCVGMGNDGISNTYGAKMYGSNSSYYFIATNSGVRMQGGSNSIFVINRGCYSSEEIATSSDRRIKNSISYEMDKYKKFYLQLKPTAYRLNNGDSNRFHIGFIAQDVEEAIKNSEIETSDFAGFIHATGENDAHGEYENQYYLRYTNFIALNTYMIQCLYSEIKNLKEQISILKGE